MEALQRGRKVLTVLLALAVLAAGVGYLIEQSRPHEPLAQLASPLAGAAPREEITEGSLGAKYLTASELRALKLKGDPDRVKYLKGLDLNRWAVACERGIECLPTIEPEFQSVREADAWLGEGDLVLSVWLGQAVKAYPLRVIAWHQVLNDELGGVPVVVTYCPLTGAGLAYKRPLSPDGRPLEFGASGRLYNANILLYDRESGSFWQQFTGEVISGPLLGRAGRLKRVGAEIVPWGSWKRGHPRGLVLARPHEVRFGRRKVGASPKRYEEYPYGEYELRRWVGYGIDVEALDLRGIFPKRRVVGIALKGAARGYLRSDLEKTMLINDRLGDEPVLMVMTPAGEARFFRRTIEGRVLEFVLEDGKIVDKGTGTLWSPQGRALSGPLASESAALEEIPATPSYWFAWVLFHPEGDLYPGD